MVKRKPRSSYHHGDLRSALIEAAAALAAKHGVDAVTLKELARKTGVSSTAPFRHFATRDELLLAVAEEAANRLAARTEAAMKTATSAIHAQQLGAVAYVRFAVEEPGYFRALSRPQALESPVIAKQDEAAQLAMRDVFGAGKKSASQDVAKLGASHLAAQALVFGLARMIVDGHLGDVDADAAERLTIEVTDVLGEGLAAAFSDRAP